MNTPFAKILIANRGEIAVRIIRSAQALGYRTVAVYSDADRHAPHVQLADEAVPIGASPPGESYLSVPRLLEAARRSGADALHPGYGFLSENAAFAAACREGGLVFIGPSAEAIALMGNKAAAKRRMLAAEVPCVPGYQGAAQDDATLRAEAAAIGFPLMVKAAAGGGGRGMRLVQEAAELPAALASARSEAASAFGSDELILERAILRPRHVEIQVFADRHGNVIHLGERDCSIQRRHQKVVEEAPCPVMTPELRARMGEAAVAAARAIAYEGAGTIEFLLGEDGHFYFMEMNTRLQVEHPVTELVTGQDLVAWQLMVAAGAPLPLAQHAVTLRGHAIEVRLYAEDPYRGFLPQTGRVLEWDPPSGVGIRVDDGLRSGLEISPYYDPMLAKIVAHGASREEARRRLLRALEDCTVLGPTTNRAFLIDCLAHAAFAAGEATTAFIDTHFPAHALTAPAPDSDTRALAAVLLHRRTMGWPPSLLDEWRSNGPAVVPLLLEIGDTRSRAEITALGAGEYRVAVGETLHTVTLLDDRAGHLRYAVDGLQRSARFCFDGDTLHLGVGALTLQARDRLFHAASAADQAASDGRVLASMSGTIVAIHVRESERVRRGQPLLVLEAMKMEHPIVAPMDGVVSSIKASVGKQVANRALLVELGPAA
jgi:geranyl-CoA carboxylase alpha subunit